MCLILFGWHAHPAYRLVLAANRDELYSRAALPLHAWDDHPIVGGRDRAAGGTWLGVRDGRFAAVTNVREGRRSSSDATRSRGQLPVDFLDSAASPREHTDGLLGVAMNYGAFNLLCADADAMWWGSNRPQPGRAQVADGVHGLSNAALDTPWPKVVRGTTDFADALARDTGSPDSSVEEYFHVLADRSIAPRRDQPDTGVGTFLEARFSARFVRIGYYGTRCSTVLRIRTDGSYDITERRFGWPGQHGEKTMRMSGH